VGAGECEGIVVAKTSSGYEGLGELTRVTGGDAGLTAEIIETFLQDVPAKLATGRHRENNAVTYTLTVLFILHFMLG